MRKIFKIGCLGIITTFIVICLLAKTGTGVLEGTILFVLIARVLLRLLKLVLHVIAIFIFILLILNALI
ncbi:hypothetical protein [Butyricimonas synergistica]|uniref:hypothetical protein n=1 Tax=Butyricimonas synergistica TaxID=544644 RepID=UPI00036D3281|nr:hypothetical protein [Butyricimonas synergistica]